MWSTFDHRGLLNKGTNFEEAYFAGDWSHDMYSYSIEAAFPAGQHAYVRIYITTL